MDPRLIFLLPGIPRLLITRFGGWLAKLRIPPFLRPRLWAWLGKRLKIDAAQIPGDLRDYPNFLALFTRGYPKDSRPLPDDDSWLSPSDGQIVEHTHLNADGSWLIKGVPYSTKELLPGAPEMEGWEAVQIYLSPRDYHRYHAPCDCEVISARCLPGDLRTVDPKLMRRGFRIMATNRRVLLHCKTPEGEPFAMLYVGALNVGRMLFTFDETLGKNFRVYSSRVFDPPPTLLRGQEMGRFEFGSTILLFLPPGKKLLVPLGEPCKARAPLFA